MSGSTTISRMFELTNQTFRQHFVYILSLASIFITIGFMVTLVAAETLSNQLETTVFFVAGLMLLIYTKLAVMIHRLVILKEKGLGLIFRWELTEFKFIGWILATIVILGLMFFFIIEVSMDDASPTNTSSRSTAFIMIIAVIVIGVIFSRLSLIFPATAAGHKFALSQAWEVSRNHTFLLFTLVILVPYVTNRIFKAIPEGQIFWSLVVEIVSVLIIIYEVGLLSHCYESLTQNDNELES